MPSSRGLGAAVTASASVNPFDVRVARARLNRTPVRLRLTAAVLAIAAIALGVIAATAATTRRDAAHSVSASSEPQLMLAEGVYALLSDGDATAATTFLTGGIESPWALAVSARPGRRQLPAGVLSGAAHRGRLVLSYGLLHVARPADGDQSGEQIERN